MSRPTPPAAPFVQDAGTRRSLHFTPQEIQSSMSLLNPDALEIEYTRMMMGFLLFNPAPAHILMVGLGGGSLPKFCHRYLPRSRITVVEIDPAVIALREAFMVPPDGERFQVVEADAAQYLRGLQGEADVVLLDGYVAGGIPAPLCTAAFYADCHRALREDGLLVNNFHFNHADYHRYLDRLREAFGHAMFEVVDDDMTNSVVFACKGDLLEDPAAAELKRPPAMAKEGWRQLLQTFKVIGATLELR
ncbi:fused MFS/spermidine synthase [Bordetella genomosp. 13]|uniref:fused MFS/spermidine synthase n=1 Tax=Bordetella genomosp. 13 TaxID=463040 RepID=UPI0011A26CB0|nr:fused MFS/spermidine synthase [Bordetella genomosp. 13]